MFQIKPLGDRGLRVQLGDTISKETNEKIRSLSFFWKRKKYPGLWNGFQLIRRFRFITIHSIYPMKN